MGQGFDRHFFGLRQTAEHLGREPHPLFTHRVFQQMGHFVLSTSTLSTNTIQFGGFGPVVPDGLGVGYNVSDQRLGAVVTAYKVRNWVTLDQGDRNLVSGGSGTRIKGKREKI